MTKDEDLKMTVRDRTVDTTDMSWQRGKSRDRQKQRQREKRGETQLYGKHMFRS